MVSKEERENDKAICEAATRGPWWQGDSDEAPRVEAHEGGALGDDRLGSADEVHSGKGGPDEWIATEFRREEDARFTAAARNRLPLYIADAEETERRIATLADIANDPETHHATASVLLRAVKILRGEK